MPGYKNPIASNNYQGPLRSLVLAGGGVRLAYQAGVLQALQQVGLQFNHVDGTSGGIFNTGMLASGIEPEEMANNWRSLKIKYFMSTLPFKSYLRPLKIEGFGDADGIRTGVFPSLGIDISKIRNNKNFVSTFNVCNFSEKTIESFSGEEVSEDLLIAGVSLPIFMPSILFKETWYTDAVWIKDANLMEAAKRGAQEIWLVWAIGNTRAYLTGSFNQYVHMIEMSANGGLLEEFEQIKALNDRIRKGDSPYGQAEPIRLHVIKPQFPLPLDPDLFFNKIDTSALINMGYADAMNYVKYSLNSESGTLIFGDGLSGERPPSGNGEDNPYSNGGGEAGNVYPPYNFKGIPFNGSATKMNEPGVSLNFRMLFKGILVVNGEETRTMYRIAFNIRNFGKQTSLFVNSSICLDSLSNENSTYNNKVEIKTSPKSITINSDFRHEGGLFHIYCEIPINSALDWRIGLEFRKAKIWLSKSINGKNQVIGEGTLTQKTTDRIRYLIRCNLYDPEGFHKRRTKHKMMQWLYK